MHPIANANEEELKLCICLQSQYPVGNLMSLVFQSEYIKFYTIKVQKRFRVVVDVVQQKELQIPR